MNKRRMWLGLLLALPLLGSEPLIQTAKLKTKRPPFSLRRDLFQGIGLGPQAGAAPATAPVAGNGRSEPDTPVAPGEPSVDEEIYRSISYAGYTIRMNRRTALLNISGDFQLASEGDLVLDRFKVTSIRADAVVIEYEGKSYEIRLAGDN